MELPHLAALPLSLATRPAGAGPFRFVARTDAFPTLTALGASTSDALAALNRAVAALRDEVDPAL